MNLDNPNVMTHSSVPSFQDIHVLIVGDSKTLSKIIGDFLISIGFSQKNFHQVNNAGQVLALVESVQIDLIITSLWLPPPQNGLELLQSIRNHANDKVRSTAFVMLAGEDHPAHREKAHSLKIDGFLTKPFKVEAMKWTLDRVFRQGQVDLSSDKSGLENKNESSATNPLFSLAGMRIMLVDDSVSNLMVLKRTLGDEDLILEAATSAESALQKLSETLPDLIVLDVVMAGMNGFEVCRIIKNEQRTQHIPIIFLTGLDQNNNVLEGFNAGGIDYVAKPFVPEEVKLRVRTHLRLVQVTKEREQLIDELLALKEDLERQAVTDPLTGLSNRRGMWKQIDEVKQSMVEGATDACLIIADVDHFKKVNDTFGHSAGDSVLQELSKRLQQPLESSQVLARWGGEEFLVLLPQTSLDQAKQIAENLRTSVSQSPIEYEEKSLAVTMSFGVSTFDGSTVTPEQALQRADEALYHAKESGRNRVVTQEIA